MKRNQSGFTLIEIAIVLVIIGLLLGGVMKGQELINSAKVKNLAADFKNTSLYIYSYQDKFRTLPGDDPQVGDHVTGASAASPTATLGNGRIDGRWDDYSTLTTEAVMFWQHVRLAGIATGITTPNDTSTAYPPRNTLGGLIGVTNSVAAAATDGLPIATLKGSYIICSGNIQGKFAKQLDIMMDDGVTNSGSMMTALTVTASTGSAAVTPKANNDVEDSTLYTVCMGV